MSAPSTPGHPSEEAGGEGAAEPVAGPLRVPANGSRRERALLIVTLVLIVAASAAFLRAQTLKLEPSPVKRPRVESVFSPVCGCEDTTAGLSFGLRRASRVDAQMIDSDARIVRMLADGAERPAGRQRLEWDGRDDAGRLVADGAYRLRLFLDEEREVVVPRAVVLDTQAPRAALGAVVPRVVAAPRRGRDARRRAERASSGPAAVALRYRSSEAGRAILLVDGRPAVRSASRPPGRSSLRWDARLDGRALAAGVYELSLRVRDRAGNSSMSTRTVDLRVRRSR